MKEHQEPRLIVVMPIYNEEANISSVVSEWAATLDRTVASYEMLAIDDGSKDRTLDILTQLAAGHSGRITVITKPNSGHGQSCRLGYERAVQSNAQWVLQIDSDGQCDPAYFPEFWSRTAHADCVFGLRKTRGDGLARKLISAACGSLSSLVAGVSLADANVPYRLIRRDVLARALQKIPADFDIQNVALTVALKRLPGLRWVDVPIHFRERQGGANSINIPKIAQMGWRMLNELSRIER